MRRTGRGGRRLCSGRPALAASRDARWWPRETSKGARAPGPRAESIHSFHVVRRRHGKTHVSFGRVWISEGENCDFAHHLTALIKGGYRPLTCPACPCHTGDRFILPGQHRWRLVTELDGCQRAQMPRGLHPALERHRRLLAGRGQPESRAHAIASHSARATCVCTRALPRHSQLRRSARAARIARRAV